MPPDNLYLRFANNWMSTSLGMVASRVCQRIICRTPIPRLTRSAPLAWVNETPDPNKCGYRHCDAVRRGDTSQVLAQALLLRSSGPSVGNTTVRHAANM